MKDIGRSLWYNYILPNDKPYTPTKTERNLLYLAYSLSVNFSDIGCSKHSCFILDENNNVLCTNVNTKIEGVTDKGSRSIHAEEGAINQFKLRYLDILNPKKCKLLVVRGNLEGEFCISRPCFNCYQDILSSGIEEVIYSVGPERYCRMYVCSDFSTAVDIEKKSKLN